LLNQYHNPNKDILILQRLAESADQIMTKFEPRSLSNLAYAFALVGYNPNLPHNTLLEKVADASIICSKRFNEKDVSNMVWAYATLKILQPKLFQSLGDVVSLAHLDTYKPQSLAIILFGHMQLLDCSILGSSRELETTLLLTS
jgi:hypothetical protein